MTRINGTPLAGQHDPCPGFARVRAREFREACNRFLDARGLRAKDDWKAQVAAGHHSATAQRRRRARRAAKRKAKLA